MASPKGRAPTSGAFKAGQSGNPTGRPTTPAEIVAYARERSLKALRVIYSMMIDKRASPAVRLASAQAILDRGLGRAPAAPVVLDPTESMTDAEIVAAMREAVAKAKHT